MRKVFWDNPYQTRLLTTVAAVNRNEIVFNETIAYTFSGGQESDRATVNGIEILSSRKDDQEHLIYYTFPENHGFSVNQKVKMEIDWPRRNKLMRLHFACELILVLINRLFGNKKSGEELKPEEIDNLGIKKTGAHISEKDARIDFSMVENINQYFEAILKQYNEIIRADLPIEKGYLDEKNQIRYWKVPGLATVPCGGTHVNSTAEVGYINLKRENAGKNLERIRITLVDPTPSKNEISDEHIKNVYIDR